MQARVDECLLNDVRFKALVELYQSVYGDMPVRFLEDLALGECIRAFWLAQKYWRDDRSLVPKAIWKLAKHDYLLRVGLALEKEDGIYVCGSMSFFDWYHGKAEAGRKGGLESGKVRKSKKIEAVLPKQRSKTDEAGSCSVSVSVSDSVSVSGSVSVSKTKKITEGLKSPGPSPSTFDLELGQAWLDYAKTRVPKIKADPKKYADAIRRLQSSGGLSEAEVTATFEWVKRSDFWAKNALSPEGLFKRGGNGLRKLDTIRAQMLEEAGPGIDWGKVFGDEAEA